MEASAGLEASVALPVDKGIERVGRHPQHGEFTRLALREIRPANRKRVGEAGEGQIDIDAAVEPGKRVAGAVQPMSFRGRAVISLASVDGIDGESEPPPRLVEVDLVEEGKGLPVILADHAAAHRVAGRRRAKHEMLKTL